MIIRHQPRSDTEPQLEMTPLIDMVFLLLIFFLIATTIRQTERELDIALPTASSAKPISAALREIIVNVDVQGRIVVGGERLPREAFENLIRQAVAANPQQKVTVRGDRRAAYDHIVGVLDICRTAGIAQPYLDTVVPAS